MKNIRVIDFFSGAGGFSEGFRQEGFKVIMGIDNWLPAVKTHNLNHDLNDEPRSVLDFEDINNIHELPDSEIIVGSPPCVSFSLSNKGGNGDKTLGIRLIKAYLKVVAVKKHQPNSILKAWLMENVPNSRNYVQEEYTFEDLGLAEWAKSINLKPKATALTVKENGAILKASDFGAPQARNRFVCGEIVATNKFPYPSKSTKSITLSDIMSHLPSPLGKAHQSGYTDPNYPSLSLDYKEITDHFYDTGVYEVEWRKAQAAKQNHPYMGPMSFPENKQNPSRTLLATRSASTREAILYESELKREGNGQYRIPTIREGASLMGFPISYIFYGNESHKWRQIGNAVCPQLSSALARQIKNELDLKLSKPRFKKIDTSSLEISFQDNHKEKAFDNPPRKSPKAAFRGHPIKSGNMTVALTNKHSKLNPKWTTVAYVGTGKAYKAIEINYSYYSEAERIITDINPDLIRKISNDSRIQFIPQKDLDQLNATYHYSNRSGEHPLSLVNRVAEHISNEISEQGDFVVDVSNSVLSSIKDRMPISQLLAIYSLGRIVIKPKKQLEDFIPSNILSLAYSK